MIPHRSVPRRNGDGEMVETASHKYGAVPQTDSGKRQKKGPTETCEICGQKMERDPESGEFLCPYCYYSDEME